MQAMGKPEATKEVDLGGAIINKKSTGVNWEFKV